MKNVISMWTLLFLGAVFSLQVKAQMQRPEQDEADFRHWCKTIGSDAFGGRKPMTKYEERTIQYLADEFRKLGLKPAFGDSYFQAVKEISTITRPQKNRIEVKGVKGKQVLGFPDDLVIWTHRGTDKVQLTQAEFVFCGFGIDAPEYGWNDYDGVDVQGKIVIAMVNDPGFYDKNLFRGKNMTYYGRWTYKLEEAQKKGAAGCLVLHNTAAASYAWNVPVASHVQGNLGLCDETMNAGDLGMKGWIHEEGARKIFQVAGLDFDETIASAKKPGFKSIVLKAKTTATLNVTYQVAETHNVAAVLPGTDLKDECLVFNAHWDHFGVGDPIQGDSIYNGAADNASGIATILTMAKKYQQLPIKPRRSLVFMSVTSEESGMFGSQYYCEHPSFPMEKTAACINFDCVAPASLAHDIIVLGGGECELDYHVMSAAASQGRYMVLDNDNSDGWFFRSDHFNFVKRGVPAVVLKNGEDFVNPVTAVTNDKSGWYHKPNDEYHDTWDVQGSLANMNLMFSVGLNIANADAMPQWFKTSASHR